MQNKFSGDFFVSDFVCKDWVYDCHNYKLKQFKKALKTDKREVLFCKYSRGTGIQTDGFITPCSFTRRAWWLVDNPEYVFIHYLDEQDQIEFNNNDDHHPINSLELDFKKVLEIESFVF